MIDLETLTLSVTDRMAVLTVNRPGRMNSMTVRMFTEFGLVAEALRDTEVRTLVITGAGDRAFCAGFDLDEIHVIADMTVREFLRFQETATGGLAALHTLPFPVIAAINGAASGGGLSLALAADLRLAVPTATFRAPFTKVGLSVGDLGTSWLLPRLIGTGRAAELVYTARPLDAAEAERIGLVNRVVPAESLMATVVELAESIQAHSSAGIGRSKRALLHNQEGSYSTALHTI
ncbi:enoyl-CoA hydratase/isomerase family protein [Labedaea rhizosphaerae]|uniref:Enoyl-CoA hydratase /trans-2,cis-3 decenoyl-[acyl-carrier-protein] isomerase n=1 Tax=Labedaea rhizosphaerae TaxID=598644 RepID=A0A4R6RXQ7_LABRH|nr:enoyl-CoA hydratase/isomerase family protein [Labedaea rhizosphaerae]TDP91882.1 enoyl-CoA hydratase /trans-2,cis-3 decenoyl-[acyl-carrier-protein] isomerase [Labedaea rhizosphaerae]